MSQTECRRTQTAELLSALTATLFLLVALATPTLLFGCAQEQTLSNEANIGAVSLRYPDTVEPASSEPSSSTVTTADGFSYEQKSMSFQNADRTLAFDIHLCEGVSHDDALAYAKAAVDEAIDKTASDDDAALFEKHGVNSSSLPPVTFEAPQEGEASGRASFTQLSTAGEGEAKAVHFVQCIDAGEGSIVYLEVILPEQTFLENEDVLRTVGQSIRIDDAK